MPPMPATPAVEALLTIAPPRARGEHRAQLGSQAEEDAREVLGEVGVPVGRVEVLHAGRRARAAGIVEGAVEAAEALERGIDERVGLRLHRHVRRDEGGLAAGVGDLARERLARVGAAAAEHDPGTLGGDPARHGAADPARRAGDEDHAPVEAPIEAPGAVRERSHRAANCSTPSGGSTASGNRPLRSALRAPPHLRELDDGHERRECRAMHDDVAEREPAVLEKGGQRSVRHGLEEPGRDDADDQGEDRHGRGVGRRGVLHVWATRPLEGVRLRRTATRAAANAAGRALHADEDHGRTMRVLPAARWPVGADGLLPRVGGGGRRHRLTVVAACSLSAAGRGEDCSDAPPTSRALRERTAVGQSIRIREAPAAGQS
jgi:hypothetical protein